MTYWGFVALHIYKNSILQSNNIRFDAKISYGEDELFYINTWERVDSLKIIEKVYYFYRHHDNSAMNQLFDIRNRQKRLDSVLQAMIMLKEGLEKGIYTKQETVSLLRGRYGLCPYLVANMDRCKRKAYLSTINTHNLFDPEFVRQYELPTKTQFFLLYRKEWFVDRMITLIKQLLPDEVVKFIKSLLKNKE